MAYTRPWSDTFPPGSELANKIDDFFREFRVDIHDRMNDVVEDWTADPVVLKAGIAANKGHSYRYEAGRPTSEKAQNHTNIVTNLLIQYYGNTDGSGNITIDFDEIPDWNVIDIIGVSVDTKPLFLYWGHFLPNRAEQARWANTNLVENTMRFQILEFEDQVLENKFINCLFMFFSDKSI